MNKLKLVALFIALSSVAVFAQGSGTSVAGNWKVTGDVVGNAVDLNCTFAQDGAKLTGSCKATGADKSSDITGSVDDKKVTWKFDTTYDGRQITLTFNGTLDASAQLKGDIDVQPFGVTGEFSASKEEAKKEEPKKPQS